MSSQTSRAPMARRLTRMNLLVTGSALMLAAAALMVYDFLTFRASIIRNLTIQAQIVAANTESALAFDDPVTAERTLRALAASTRVEGAVVLRMDREVFATYVSEPVDDQFRVPHDMALTDPPRLEGLHVHLVHPIVLDGTRLGGVYIRASLRDLLERLAGYGVILMAVSALSMGAAFFVSRTLRDAISRPLVRLAEVAGRVSRDQDYGVRAEVGVGGEVGALASAFNEMLEQIQQRDRGLKEVHDLLEERVRDRTAALDASNAALNASNQELEAFCYSVSHDLRGPLRGIDGFSLALLEDDGPSLTAEGRTHLSRIRANTVRMGALIDDLLNLSRVTRADFRRQPVDLSVIARSIIDELVAGDPGRQIELVVEENVLAIGDPRLLRQALDNLVRNAWKFTSKKPVGRIEFGRMDQNGETTYFVRDNGAGFDMAYADRLFGTFQRLHAMHEFPGTGVGLAIVHRIVRRHGGRIWADATVDGGATFFFTLQHGADDVAAVA